MHSLFECVEWLDTTDVKALGIDSIPACDLDPDTETKLLAEFQSVFTATEMESVFARPTGNVELWREKAFDAVIWICRI